MKREQIVAMEYGAAKNGAIIFFLPEIQSLLLEWKGDILIEEWIEILTRGIEEVRSRKVTKWIGDTSGLGATTEEHDRWVQEMWTPKVAEAGLKKLSIVLPNDIVGEMTMQEMIDNIKETATKTNVDLQSFYTTSFEEAVEWIKD